MNTYTAIGLLMILTTICLGILQSWWFGARAAAQITVLTAMAKLQGAMVPENQS